MLCGGELMQEEMPGFKDKEAKNKTLLLAALRVAAVDAGHCADMPETDFAAIGGKKERLPPSLMANKRLVEARPSWSTLARGHCSGSTTLAPEQRGVCLASGCPREHNPRARVRRCCRAFIAH